MDLHNLNAASENQAAATSGSQGTLNVQKGDADSKSTPSASSTDTVDISAEARAKAAGSSAAVASSSDSDSGISARITKLQKQLQQIQGASDLPEDQKRSQIATLRTQIQTLQSQEPKSGTNTASSGASASSLTPPHA